jgi:hypothetical protein
MEDHENIYDKIKELLGTLPNQLCVLEDQIEVELQLEYFELSRSIRSEKSRDHVLEKSFKLFLPEISVDEKKNILAGIASLGKVEAFRFLEEFQKSAPVELKKWSVLALQENRLLLESRLLDQSHVFVSTGLGGKGDKLRYFIVLFGREITEFSDLQKKIIRIEMEIGLKKYNSELEMLNFSGSMATMKVMIPMKVIIKQVFNETIAECNQYGNFLIPDFIITNVKALSFQEIRDYLEKQRKRISLTEKSK